MIKEIVKSILLGILSIVHPLNRLISQNIQSPSINQQIQTSLQTQWLMAKKQNIKVFDDIKDAGFRCYSQYEEDGIILYLLSMVGISNRTVVEICCGTGDVCMATNLIINHGFKGYLFDGDASNIRFAKSFFAHQTDCRAVKPNITKAWITKDNVNDLIRESGIEGEVDLFSLDIDGNDYYIWEAIDVIRPRICVFETHDMVPTNLAVTIPYKEDFYVWDKPGTEKYFRSVSLAAMDKLARKKGYTLVGSHKHGFNVFYVRNDLLHDLLPTPTLESIHDNAWTRHAQDKLWPLAKEFPWVKV